MNTATSTPANTLPGLSKDANEMLDAVVTLMQGPTPLIAICLSARAYKVLSDECGCSKSSAPSHLCDVPIHILESQEEPVKAFFDKAELAAYLRS